MYGSMTLQLFRDALDEEYEPYLYEDEMTDEQIEALINGQFYKDHQVSMTLEY